MFHGDLALSRHQRAVREHVPVVRGIDREQPGRWSDDLPIALVRIDRFRIGVDGLLPAAPADIDVRRHVNVVRQARLQVAQSVGRRVRALGIPRRFDRVNVKMVRERMFRIEFQDRVECRQDFIRPRLRLAFRRPLIPRAQIHHCFREKRAHVGIGWMRLPNFPHRIGIRQIERTPVFRLRIGITMAERLDQRALDRRGFVGILLRELQFLPGQFGRRRRDERIINMRPAGQRDAPMRHGAFRIETRRFLESIGWRRRD